MNSIKKYKQNDLVDGINIASLFVRLPHTSKKINSLRIKDDLINLILNKQYTTSNDTVYGALQTILNDLKTKTVKKKIISNDYMNTEIKKLNRKLSNFHSKNTMPLEEAIDSPKDEVGDFEIETNDEEDEGESDQPPGGIEETSGIEYLSQSSILENIYSSIELNDDEDSKLDPYSIEEDDDGKIDYFTPTNDLDVMDYIEDYELLFTKELQSANFLEGYIIKENDVKKSLDSVIDQNYEGISKEEEIKLAKPVLNNEFLIGYLNHNPQASTVYTT